MKNKHIASASITIRADREKVWDALTNPAIIKQYLFGTDASSDWKKGSPITYRGVWEGKEYEDRGVILETIQNKLLKSTYWSAFSGLPDLPENYNTVTYELAGDNGETLLTITQDNVVSAETAEHSASNWRQVLEAMKKILEK